jgi:hypothetical protein
MVTIADANKPELEAYGVVKNFVMANPSHGFRPHARILPVNAGGHWEILP